VSRIYQQRGGDKFQAPDKGVSPFLQGEYFTGAKKNRKQKKSQSQKTEQIKSNQHFNSLYKTKPD
jgi:hypothetical protein